MTTTNRDPIAQTIAAHQLETYHGTCTGCDWDYAFVPGGDDVELVMFHARHVAEVVRALSVTLPDSTTETRTEWGVRRPPKFDSTVAWMTNRGEAESLAKAWDNGSVVVSRPVYVGEWSEVES